MRTSSEELEGSVGHGLFAIGYLLLVIALVIGLFAIGHATVLDVE
jgi:hypothetical protein